MLLALECKHCLFMCYIRIGSLLKVILFDICVISLIFRLILGGGVIKHHVCNANLMRNGADFSVFINTGQVINI